MAVPVPPPPFSVSVDSKGVTERVCVSDDSKWVAEVREGERALARDTRSGQTFFVECLSVDSRGLRGNGREGQRRGAVFAGRAAVGT